MLGDGDGVGEVDGRGVAVGVGEVEGRGDVVGVGEAVGVLLGVGDGVVVGVIEPVPGQVCDKRIPESEPLICAKVPA